MLEKSRQNCGTTSVKQLNLTTPVPDQTKLHIPSSTTALGFAVEQSGSDCRRLKMDFSNTSVIPLDWHSADCCRYWRLVFLPNGLFLKLSKIRTSLFGQVWNMKKKKWARNPRSTNCIESSLSSVAAAAALAAFQRKAAVFVLISLKNNYRADKCKNNPPANVAKHGFISSYQGRLLWYLPFFWGQILPKSKSFISLYRRVQRPLVL